MIASPAATPPSRSVTVGRRRAGPDLVTVNARPDRRLLAPTPFALRRRRRHRPRPAATASTRSCPRVDVLVQGRLPDARRLPAGQLLPARRRAAPPDINYLAKDYNGFRQVMLDRLAVLAPGWTETHAADLGVALVEVLAYAADHLSYQQDAVGTEAYLGTARSRISLRRHARLVDYQIGEGCNARALVAVTARRDGLTLPAGHPLLPRRARPARAVRRPSTPRRAQLGGTSSQPVFTSHATSPLTEQNEIEFYTWGDANCCLPAGATAATLTAAPSTLLAAAAHPDLRGGAGPADRRRRGRRPRAPLRRQLLTATDRSAGPYHPHGTITRSPGTAADALPFPLCISSTTDADHGPCRSRSASRAATSCRADHGGCGAGEAPAPVPQRARRPGRVGQRLRATAQASAAAALAALLPAARAVPADLRRRRSPPPASRGRVPRPGPSRRDAGRSRLTDTTAAPGSAAGPAASSGPPTRTSCPRSSSDGTVFLRFGDGQHGAAPSQAWASPRPTGSATARPGTSAATPRARLLARRLRSAAAITAVPQPARRPPAGPIPRHGAHPPVRAVRLPTQQRCVTEDDYGVSGRRSAASARRAARCAGREAGTPRSSPSSRPRRPDRPSAHRPHRHPAGSAADDGHRRRGRGGGHRRPADRDEICVDPAHFRATCSAR